MSKKIVDILKLFFIVVMVTAVLLLVMAYFAFKLEASDNWIGVMVLFCYLLGTFVAGLCTAKISPGKRLFKGIFAGGVYFLIILIISFFVGQNNVGAVDVITKAAICMLGGGMGCCVSR